VVDHCHAASLMIDRYAAAHMCDLVDRASMSKPT